MTPQEEECNHEYEYICDAGGKFKTGRLEQCNKCKRIKWTNEGIGSLF